MLFVDEIHRFNKAQQDALLPYVEEGIIILVGATTENPFFEVNKALISRSTLFQLKSLTEKNIMNILKRALNDKDRGYGKYNIKVDDEVICFLISLSNGDARIALNALELAIETSELTKDNFVELTMDTIQNCIQKSQLFLINQQIVIMIILVHLLNR